MDNDCSLSVICAEVEIPSINSNTFGKANDIPKDDSLPSTVTVNPQG